MVVLHVCRCLDSGRLQLCYRTTSLDKVKLMSVKLWRRMWMHLLVVSSRTHLGTLNSANMVISVALHKFWGLLALESGTINCLVINRSFSRCTTMSTLLHRWVSNSALFIVILRDFQLIFTWVLFYRAASSHISTPFIFNQVWARYGIIIALLDCKCSFILSNLRANYHYVVSHYLKGATLWVQCCLDLSLHGALSRVKYLIILLVPTLWLASSTFIISCVLVTLKMWLLGRHFVDAAVVAVGGTSHLLHRFVLWILLNFALWILWRYVWAAHNCCILVLFTTWSLDLKLSIIQWQVKSWCLLSWIIWLSSREMLLRSCIIEI